MSQHLQEIDAALDRGDTVTAAKAAEKALSAGHDDGIVYNLVAWLREEQGEFEEAERLIMAALERDPGDPTLHVGHGIVIRKQGRMREAVDCFERAIELDAAYGAAWYERGATFERGGAISDAGDDYRHALALEPGNPVFMGALATICARRGELGEAKALAGKALQIEPGVPGALRALAQVAVEEKRFADAVELLQHGGNDGEEGNAGRLSLLGDALEGLGRFDEAYEAYAQGKAEYLALNAGRLAGGGPEEMLARLEATATAFAMADKTPWRTTPSASPAPVDLHVFLTGHPRSGTTLAENILASLPRSLAIEERPTLAGLSREIMTEPGGFEMFAALPPAEIEAARAEYWQRAQAAAIDPIANTLFVDMDPFKGSRLPILGLMFPKAKYVITRRDPRDVVWSCFHTSFALNPGTATFGTLENTARHYAAIWTIIEETLAIMELDWFELRYESLVRDFDETTQALCAFLGVPWSEEVRKFDRTAQRRGVSTASATQVRQGLYDGSGGWRRYEQQIASVEHILRPWIERFGYA